MSIRKINEKPGRSKTAFHINKKRDALGAYNQFLYSWCMSEHIYKSHNKSLLMHHLVFPAKYRRNVFSKAVEISLRDICLEISRRFEIYFVVIGMEEDHVPFVVQSVPTYPVYKIVNIIKVLLLERSSRPIKKLRKNCGVQLSGQVNTTQLQQVNLLVQR